MSATICPSCLSRSFDAGRCGKCGFVSGEYTAARTALPLGSLVGNYRIGVMKSNSRQSQIYTAVHNETSVPVIIEEFFPAKVAGRAQNAEEVTLASADPEVLKRFQQGCLLIEASAQKRPLKRIDTVRANNTVYSVFEPVTTVNAATQCEMMADNPYYFRDQNGMPQMTINTLLIPPMPEERKYSSEQYLNRRPITKPSDESDRFSGSVITESAESANKSKKGLIIGIIAAAVVLLVVGALIVKHILDNKVEPEQTELPPAVVTEPAEETDNPEKSTSPETAETEVTATPEVAEDVNVKPEDGIGISGTGGRGQQQDDNGVIINGVAGETDKTADDSDKQAADNPDNTGSSIPTEDDGEENKEEWKVKEGADDLTTNANDATVTEAPTAEVDNGTVNTSEDFQRYLLLVSRAGKETIQGYQFNNKKKNDFDDTKKDFILPARLEMNNYEKGSTGKRVTSLFWTKGKNNQLFARAMNGAVSFKVQVGKKTELPGGGYEYQDDEDLVICLKLWQDLGNCPKGTLMVFAPETAGDPILKELDNGLTTALLWDNQTFTLKEENDRKYLVITASSMSVKLKLEPLSADETETEDVTDSGDGNSSAEGTEVPADVPNDIPTTAPTEAPAVTPTETPAVTPTEAPTVTPTNVPEPTATKEGNDTDANGLIQRSSNDTEGNTATEGNPAEPENEKGKAELSKYRTVESVTLTETELTVVIRAEKSAISSIAVEDSFGNSIPLKRTPTQSYKEGWLRWEFSKKISGKIESVKITYNMQNGQRQTETRKVQ